MLKGSYIKEFRIRKNIYLIDLAEKLGVSASQLSQIENDEINCPSIVEEKFFQIYEKLFNRVDMDVFKECYPHNGELLFDFEKIELEKVTDSSYSKINNFILNNDVNLIMEQIIDMKLEKSEIKLLFDEMLEHAKILKKERS